MPELGRELITEDWLKSIGFKWAQFDRQPEKQWTLWLGWALVDQAGEGSAFSGPDDIGLDLHIGTHWKTGRTHWSCFLRSDSAGRYHRFIHLRYLVFQDELISLIQAITGRVFVPEDCFYGSMMTPEHAAHVRAEHARIDQRMLRERTPWYEAEKDPERSRPTPEHVDAAIKGGLAK